jgi:hypothetical protein
MQTIAMMVSLGVVFASITAGSLPAQAETDAGLQNVFGSPYCTPNLDGPEELKAYCERERALRRADCQEARLPVACQEQLVPIDRPR